jgi:hypothetical protein
MTTDWTEWYPIGVADELAAQDEYDGYVPTIYKLLIRQSPRHAVVDYLWAVETEHMGLAGNRQATECFADRLIEIANRLKSA